MTLKTSIAHLDSEQRLLRDMWSAKERTLKDQLDLQLFNREADRIDAATKGHEAFLELNDLGVCLYYYLFWNILFIGFG